VADVVIGVLVLPGADDIVHHQMVRWLERLGHRTALADPEEPRREADLPV
jgi:hypothetical protein